MAHRIEGINRTDPSAAAKLLADNRQNMDYEDITRLEPRVQSQNRIVGSRNISDAVNSGWAPYMHAGQIAKMSGVQEPLVRILQQAQRDNPSLQILPTSGYRTIESLAGSRQLENVHARSLATRSRCVRA
jgi:hypothetical protein